MSERQKLEIADKDIVRMMEVLLMDDFMQGRIEMIRNIRAENSMLRKRLKLTRIFAWLLFSIIMVFLVLAAMSFESVEVVKEVPTRTFIN